MGKIAVLGAGAWGTALAVAVKGAGDVLIWSRNKSVVADINDKHENVRYLPGIELDTSISATVDLSDVCGHDIILLVVPMQSLRSVVLALREVGLSDAAKLVICCKGIEQDSQQLASDILAEVVPNNRVAVLSGPNFAAEIAKGLPACATLACASEEVGMGLVESLGSSIFRTYYSADIIGAQIGGAVKNVLAIACGIAIGRGLGENARAALVTRGMHEIGKLCVAKGGKMATLMGLSGVGDIMLTCGSVASRNMSLGVEVGKGATLQEVVDESQSVMEGVVTALSVMQLAKNLQVEMPICRAVERILHEGEDVEQVILGLLDRPFSVE